MQEGVEFRSQENSTKLQKMIKYAEPEVCLFVYTAVCYGIIIGP